MAHLITKRRAFLDDSAGSISLEFLCILALSTIFLIVIAEAISILNTRLNASPDFITEKKATYNLYSGQVYKQH